MELRPLCVMFLLTELILCTQTGDLEGSSPEVKVETGETVTFSCERKPEGSSEYKQIYIISDVQESHKGVYTCKGTQSSDPQYTGTSDAVTLTVSGSSPEVKAQPADHDSGFTGETVTFSCERKPEGSSEYNWFRDNKELSDAAAKQIYIISGVKESHKGVYTCKGTQSSDPQYTETSDAVTLTVSEKPKPQLTSSLEGDVLRGNSVTLYCTLTPQSAGWTFYWSKYTQSSETETEAETTSDFYTISLDKVYDRIQYKCRAGRGNPVYYTDYSNELSLTVIEKPKPVVNITPDKQVFSGEKVTFKCEIRSAKVTEWTYSLYKKDYTENPYKETQEFIISSVTDSNSGTYTCRGKSSDSQFSEDSDPVTLTVSEKPKPQLTSNIKGDVLRGNSVTLYCTLTPQSAGWKFYWSENKQRRWTETKTGSTSDSYTISSDKVYYRIQYKCRAGRENRVFYTDYSNELSLTVIESPKPTVTINPDTQVFIGETVTFRCDVQKGRDTEWTYGWFRDSNRLYPYSTTKVFSTSYDKVSHSRQYTCRGRRTSDSQMSQMSDSVTLSVSKKPKPQLTSSLKGDVLRGNSVNLSCTLTPKSAGWKFYWSKHTHSSETEVETATGSYTISSDNVYDRIQYWCRAGRGNPVYYTDYSNVLSLTVIENPKPVVNITPDKQVFRGEKVTFKCEIRSAKVTAWTYSLYKKDYTKNSYKETQEFSISSVTDSNSGTYTCRGMSSDSQFSEDSDPVTLTVSGFVIPICQQQNTLYYNLRWQ
ncbi:carcinoembryonic antigen-related cell adhesion molecule 5-like [Tachysurus vachellii]|uniref:carcinoembryonic antigen-related cell adhesion molecule 5-like n=1 Tax=Tachysurus vachellii TaxID=175792 RepID=UPI00296AB483|nr:carcinoembryonic antigen-related cell adhesion molecule 5-like [Tachysurus vachellii]